MESSLQMDDIARPVFDPQDPLAALSGFSRNAPSSAGAPRLGGAASTGLQTSLQPGDSVQVDYVFPTALPEGAEAKTFFTADQYVVFEGPSVSGAGVLTMTITYSDGGPSSTITLGWEDGKDKPLAVIGPVVSSSAKAA